ncbi:TPA: NAD(P)H-dependent oxidoreductase subunit E [Candidatus Poribacteria bacterium]|nr:NAD(P)H-dependent oxidoreductase subunit E [Candidatus Poribacteria bacterium]HEX28996.1 NAD(P)H-dependent oxidoreductase subunit E [Candidatus Poribacteria bacterium]
MDVRKINAILSKHEFDPSSVIAILQDIQAEFNYLPREALIYISQKLDLPLSQIYSLATFFRAFSLEPRGKHQITVCMGTACHVRGAPRVLEEAIRFLGIKPGETSKDMMFSLETVNCLGACALGPVVVVDGEYHGGMTSTSIRTVLEKLKEGEVEK